LRIYPKLNLLELSSLLRTKFRPLILRMTGENGEKRENE
jgi:hypothetical protein